MSADNDDPKPASPAPILTALEVADEPAAWEAAGFTVTDPAGQVPRVQIGSVELHLVGRGSGRDDEPAGGIVAWMFAINPSGSTLDGIAVGSSPAPPAGPPQHPNGVDAIDHVVLMTPDGERTAQALAAAGFEARRTREYTMGDRDMRQTFYWIGEVILEVVSEPGRADPDPSVLWGLAVVTPDLDATVAFLGDRASAARDAVQPGRRIASLRHRDLHITVPTAFMSPHPKAAVGPSPAPATTSLEMP